MVPGLVGQSKLMFSSSSAAEFGAQPSMACFASCLSENRGLQEAAHQPVSVAPPARPRCPPGSQGLSSAGPHLGRTPEEGGARHSPLNSQATLQHLGAEALYPALASQLPRRRCWGEDSGPGKA